MKDKDQKAFQKYCQETKAPNFFWICIGLFGLGLLIECIKC